jgi:hypothetical protein
LIPDDGEQFGPKTQFAERVIGIFVRAGLTTLSEHSGLLLHKEDLQQLVQRSLQPVIDALPASLAEQSRWQDVTDALLGPAASTALAAIAVNPRAFFGRDFEASSDRNHQALLGVASRPTAQASSAVFMTLHKRPCRHSAPELADGSDKPVNRSPPTS